MFSCNMPPALAADTEEELAGESSIVRAPDPSAGEAREFLLSGFRSTLCCIKLTSKINTSSVRVSGHIELYRPVCGVSVLASSWVWVFFCFRHCLSDPVRIFLQFTPQRCHNHGASDGGTVYLCWYNDELIWLEINCKSCMIFPSYKWQCTILMKS